MSEHTAHCSSSTISSLTPMTRDEAASLVRQMLRAYPVLNLHDPQGYLATLIALLMQYPLWAGQAATTAARRASEFPPSEAVLYPLLEEQVRTLRSVARIEQQRAQQLRQIEGPREERLTGEELRERHGAGWGLHPDERKSPFRPLDELCREAGVDPASLPDRSAA